MHDHPDETLRGKEPTREGRHLHEPDGFPHAMIGILFFVAIVVAIAIGVLYIATGAITALIVAALFVIAGLPLLLGRLRRGAEHWRGVDRAEEEEVEAAEAAGVAPPENSIEQLNDKLNRSPYDETVPHTQAPGDVNRTLRNA